VGGSAHSLFDLPLDRDEPRYCRRRPHTKPRERLSPILIISFNIVRFNIVRGSAQFSLLAFRLEEYATLVGLSLPRGLVHRSSEGALADQSADQGSESITKNETLGGKRPRIHYHIT
jgi:hypothetical protein